MDIIPPKDRTPIKINGKIVDDTIKSRIIIPKSNLNYTLSQVPVKIKIKSDEINEDTLIKKPISNKNSKTYSSERGINQNKDEIMKKLLGMKESDSVIQEEVNNDIVPIDTKVNNPIPIPTSIDVKIDNSINTDVTTTTTTNKSNEEIDSYENIMSKLPDLDNIEKEIPKKKIRKIVKKKIKRVKEDIKVKKKNPNIPDYDKMTDDERLIHRNDFILKFDLLRKWHPGLNIQKGIENHPNLYLVHSVYELYLGAIYNEINSNFYRGGLLLSWLCLELFGTYVLGVDTSTYLQLQINLMWAYEPIINKLSNVNFYHIVEGWSPFQQLVGLVFGSYVFIIIIKIVLSYIGKKIGQNLDGFTNTVMNFVTSMVFSKPKENALPPIIINNNVGSDPSNVISNLGGIHNVQIPQSSTLGLASQIGAATGAINLINTLSGKGGAQTQSSSPQQAAAPAARSRFTSPAY